MHNSRAVRDAADFRHIVYGTAPGSHGTGLWRNAETHALPGSLPPNSAAPHRQAQVQNLVAGVLWWLQIGTALGVAGGSCAVDDAVGDTAGATVALPPLSLPPRFVSVGSDGAVNTNLRSEQRLAAVQLPHAGAFIPLPSFRLRNPRGLPQLSIRRSRAATHAGIK